MSCILVRSGGGRDSYRDASFLGVSVVALASNSTSSFSVAVAWLGEEQRIKWKKLATSLTDE